ncbi:hypothetical protein [Rugosimonospora africana]|uniref:Uncharacterized protein n=1 Tax=Rugosimonospora africana TaxID=556532 RepID=A0A8J3QT50_9ACTN|nr:hypothetical protein [Rugosimonospora africana]GIH15173.1 hypothetical protein Raf01_33450 [Rugosimonospora africana]
MATDGARALWEDGDLRTARDFFEAAYRRAERDGDAPALAESALGLAGLGVHEHRGFAEAVAVRDRLRRAAAIVAPDSPLGLRLHARLAAESDYRSGGYAAVLDAVERAGRVADPVPVAEALNLALHCLLGPDHSALRRRLATRLARVRTPRRGDLLLGLLWGTASLVLDGDPDAVRSLARLHAALAERGHGVVGSTAQALDVMFQIRAGRFEEAELTAKECAEAGAAAGHLAAPAWHAAQLVSIRWYQGRLAELLPMLEETAALPSLSPTDYSVQSALALACAVSGDARRARGTLAGLTGYPLAGLPRSGTWLATLSQVVETAYLLGDTQTAAEAYELLAPYAQLAATIGPGVTCFGSVEHALGLARLTTGDVAAACAHLDRAVRADDALGHRPAAALARLRLATLTPAAASRVTTNDVTANHVPTNHVTTNHVATDRSTTAAGAVPDPASCRRQGRRWLVEAAGRAAVVDDCRGIAYLAVLLAHPGREIRAVDLAAGPAEPAPDGRPAPVAGEPWGTQPLLDDRAIAQYRRRLAALDEEIGDHQAPGGGPTRAAQARAERDWLRGQLRSTTGLGGRARGFAGADERARIAVGKAIRRALRSIADADAELGRALTAAIRTGQRCAYHPEGEHDDLARCASAC